MTTPSDDSFMRLAIHEASKALGRTHPNPAVGAVLVKAGKVIATGFHAKAGTPHAEVVALAKAGVKAKGSTLYSTLEPCAHHGKTPPCAEAILAAKVARVVFASSDPNPLVNGKGVRQLKKAGVKVEGHVLRDEADALNHPFFKFMRTKRPWVTLKAGMTLDGKIATATGDSKWITSDLARARAHHMRDLVDAVIVGAETVRSDDPQLTTRIAGGRHAARVVLDSKLSLGADSRVFDSQARSIVATTVAIDGVKARALLKRGVEVWRLPAKRGRVSLPALLERLGAAGLLHVMVEGGAEVHASFLREGLFDDLVLFVAPRLLGHEALTWSGRLEVRVVKQALELELVDVDRVGPDLAIIARRAQR